MPKEMTHQLNGMEFGYRGHPIFIVSEGYEPGEAEVRTQDADNPVGDGTFFGRDYLSGPEITFKMAVNSDDAGTSADHLARLTSAWRNEWRRKTPGVLSILRYYRAGRWYRVYGRPRKFAVSLAEFSREQAYLVDASFKVATPFADVESPTGGASTMTLQLLEPASDGGVVLPAVLPWTLAPSSAERMGQVVVGGVAPSPFTVRVKGPASGSLTNVALSGTGWRIAFDASVLPGETVVIDTREMTIEKNGRSIVGSLDPTTRLSARLYPGSQTLGFVGTDPSNTATATFEWFDTTPL